MNQRFPSLTVEAALYALLGSAALAVRLYHLGEQPLTDAEAREALAALAHLRGEAGAAVNPASPAYFLAAYLSFFLFGASEATARLGPALAGAGLVFVPWLLRRPLGRGAALAGAALLAVSSTLLAASRSVDGTLLAVLGLSAGLGSAWRYAHSGRRGWLLAAGVGLALGLAAGGPFLFGLTALGITLIVLALTQADSVRALAAGLAPLRSGLGSLLVVIGVAALLLVTVAGVYLRGLGALAASWTAWLSGFGPAAAGRPAELLPVFLAAYEPLLLVFGISGAVLAFRRGHRLAQGLAWFSLAAFALALVYGGREMASLAWPAAALAVLAGWALYELAASLWAAHEWPLIAMQVGIGFALAMFALINLAGFVEATRGGRVAPALAQTSFLGRAVTIPAEAQLVVSGLAVALTLVVAYLFAMGWSERASKLGLALTGLAVLLPATLSAGWGLTQARAGVAGELWWPKPASADVWRLMETLGNVSNYTTGNTHDIEVTVQASETGALRWLLRDFPNAVFVDRLGPQMSSPVVITPIDQDNPTLGSAYVGQDFDLNTMWVAPQTVAEWAGWVAYRRTTAVQAEPVILWVRQDVQQLTTTGN